ncbi:MAG: MBL fold metallo-hydrolase [Dehalococcoidales bacterium]|nr:MBL fold metallo-hydrolase [Dehalococcoidales bacterium]
MKLCITTLSENTAGLGNFMGEWGISVLVESDDLSLLFDTGQGISAAYNADLLGIDLSRVGKIILSHGHYDHTGGLRLILRKMRRDIEIIAHPDIWAAKYVRHGDQKEQYVGIPFQRDELESLGANFNLRRQATRITDSIMTTGEVPMVTDFEKIAPNLLVKEAAGFKPDRLLDDQALVITTELGLVVVLGCSHHGVINTLYHAQQLTGERRIYMVVGGCHLMAASPEQIESTITALKELDIQRLGVSHCTGLHAASIMAREFGDRFFFNNAGTVIRLP